MKKIIFILFCFLGYTLNAQYFVKKDGQWVVYYGSFVKAQNPSYTPPPPTPNFNIVKTWDYSGISLGTKTAAQMEAYYNTEIFGHSTEDYDDAIVETTINGELDTCLRIRNYDDGLAYPLGIWGSGGSEITLYLDTSMREAYHTYYVKLANDYRLYGDSKMSGPRAMKGVVSDPYPMTDAHGWINRIQIKAAGTLDTYQYDRSDGVEPWSSYGANPWSFAAGGIDNYYLGADYDFNDFMTYGSWHKVDIRIKMNTWTGGVANRDGIYEMALDDTIVFQMDGLRMHAVDADTNLFQAISISQFQNAEPIGSPDFYSYHDNHIVYIPLDDPLLGVTQFHTTMWDSPLSVPTDDYYSDSIIDIDTENVTMVSSSAWETYMWIIDAGTDSTVTISWNSGDVPSGCYVVLFDGKTAGAPLLHKYSGGISDMSAQADVTSTGQYMYVYMVCNATGGVDLSGDVTFNPPFNILYEWDFETLAYGASSYSSLEAYFELNSAGLDWWQDTIVDATIDGVTSKAMKIMAYSGNYGESMQCWTWLDASHNGYDKMCYSYNVRFDAGFEGPTDNGKLPGILVNGGGAYETNQSCPAISSDGSTIGYLFKQGLHFSDYQWNHNVTESCPWRMGEDNPSGFYFSPGTWYEITEYLVINSADGSSDGIQEIYIDGNMIFQCDTMRWRQNGTNYQFDGLRYTFFFNPDAVANTCSWTTDNHVIWEPYGDADYTAGTKHDPSYIMNTPVSLTDHTLYYDHLETTDGTYSSQNWPSAAPNGHHEAWRFEGTTNVAITFSGNLGGTDYLFVVDGGTSLDGIAYAVEGSDGDLSNNFDSGGATFTSTSDVVTVWMTNSGDGASSKVSMSVNIDP